MTDNQIAMLSAALRHVRDAEALLTNSPDQAWHIAGFGPECGRKACLEERWADKAVGHSLDDRAEGVVLTAIALDPHAQRYHVGGWASRWPVLERWTPMARYEKTGHIPRNNAKTLVEVAREAISEVVVALWADGLLDTPEI